MEYETTRVVLKSTNALYKTTGVISIKKRTNI